MCKINSMYPINAARNSLYYKHFFPKHRNKYPVQKFTHSASKINLFNHFLTRNACEIMAGISLSLRRHRIAREFKRHIIAGNFGGGGARRGQDSHLVFTILLMPRKIRGR